MADLPSLPLSSTRCSSSAGVGRWASLSSGERRSSDSRLLLDGCRSGNLTRAFKPGPVVSFGIFCLCTSSLLVVFFGLFAWETQTSFDCLSRLASPETRVSRLPLGPVSPALGPGLRLGSVPAGSRERDTTALRCSCEVRPAVSYRLERLLGRTDRSELKRLPVAWAVASRVA